MSFIHLLSDCPTLLLCSFCFHWSGPPIVVMSKNVSCPRPLHGLRITFSTLSSFRMSSQRLMPSISLSIALCVVLSLLAPLQAKLIVSSPMIDRIQLLKTFDFELRDILGFLRVWLSIPSAAQIIGTLF